MVDLRLGDCLVEFGSIPAGVWVWFCAIIYSLKFLYYGHVFE